MLKRINNPKLVGRMRSTFIVLSDDDYRKKLSRQHAKGSKPAAEAPPDVSLNSSGSSSSAISGSGSSSKSGHSKSGNKSRGSKRSADATSDSNPSKSKK